MKKVLVTGIGLVTPCGNGKAATWAAVKAGKSDAYHITAPDPSGAGAVEAAFCALALDEGFVPPTINYETPDPVCDLDYTPNMGVAKPLRAALSTSLGFGGHNGALVFRKV